MARKLFVILLVIVIFIPAVALAGEWEVQYARAGEVEILYDSDFLPPNVEAKYELERIREEWSSQELETLISKREEDDEYNF
ncbi:MAG: hypothetical protein A2359_00050 [Candidatus Moranbacteria bacterium RIFOXYB1_FULL_43_19]|nr:MAG: hypothetical protein A2184_04090 [Candidatus Moranbacteria bacterium RIFOXYA1_FULL_44_7]OGI26854.1 MAG: hypothetical protein A2359_00050 [Candidatus Moranbacteria bacterium RIFOXYB1_FULL_43_19]OGI34112.1 MAG: hypothetical protein A2420_04770 [Candidatus Moranbacteria bacterium RIFOXYC1_FULL_44_13]OGI37599.1 MAG: hypothetical protein A2612_04540 [Candidatus Moranbacteria bacterium RIFOXYD1_FULL_44_12]